ncbi:MAG: hypothetical protein U0Z75_03290 [Deinococcaceae bacterium]
MPKKYVMALLTASAFLSSCIPAYQTSKVEVLMGTSLDAVQNTIPIEAFAVDMGDGSETQAFAAVLTSQLEMLGFPLIESTLVKQQPGYFYIKSSLEVVRNERSVSKRVLVARDHWETIWVKEPYSYVNQITVRVFSGRDGQVVRSYRFSPFGRSVADSAQEFTQAIARDFVRLRRDVSHDTEKK